MNVKRDVITREQKGNKPHRIIFLSYHTNEICGQKFYTVKCNARLIINV